jgi:DNA sulfur modification protein DndC
MDATSYHGIKSSLRQFYANPSNGERPIQIDTSTPSGGNSRFGCWTCTVVEHDKASEGLLASGDERMEEVIEFREALLFCQDPANGKHDLKRKNGAEGPEHLNSEAGESLRIAA